MWLKHAKLSPEDDNSGGGGGGGDGSSDADKSVDKDDKGKLSTEEHLNRLGQALTLLAGNFDTLLESQKTLAKRFEDGIAVKPIKDDSPKEPQSLAERLKDVDTSTLDNKQLMEILSGHVGEVLDAKMRHYMGQVDEKVSGLADALNTSTARAEIEKVSTAKGNEDFFEWSREIRDLMKTHPTISVAQAYRLAKTENPDKVAELTKKYAKAPADAGKSRSFSLTPTSSRGGDSGKMTPQAAAEKAFDDVMGELEGLVSTGRK